MNSATQGAGKDVISKDDCAACGGTHLCLQLHLALIALLPYAACALAIGQAALELAAVVLPQVRRVRVPLIGARPPNLLLLLDLRQSCEEYHCATFTTKGWLYGSLGSEQ